MTQSGLLRGSIGTSDPERITLLGHDLAADLIGRSASASLRCGW
jgi:hypothetical protein